MKKQEREQIESLMKINRKKGLVESNSTQTNYYTKALRKNKQLYLLFFTYENKEVKYKYLYKTNLFDCEKYDYEKRKSGKSLILDTLGISYWSHNKVIHIYDKSTEKLLSTFNGSIDKIEWQIKKNRNNAKIKKEKAEIKALMKPLKTPSRAFFDFCESRAEHRLFFDQKDVFCTKCKNTFEKPQDLKNNKPYTCPCCNTSSKAVSKKQKVKTKYTTTLKIDSINKDLIVVRFFRTDSIFNNSDVTIETSELLRAFMYFTEEGQGKVVYYQPYYNGEWYKCVGSMANPLGINGISTFENMSVYTRYNALHILNECNKLVAGLPELIKNQVSFVEDDIWTYIVRNYKHNNILELFSKAGLYNLAKDGLSYYDWLSGFNYEAKSLAQKLKINKWYMRMMQENNLGHKHIKTMQSLVSCGYSNKSLETILLLTKLHCDTNDSQLYYSFSEKTLSKIEKYISSNSVDLINYKDYISACKKLNYKLSDFILFTKDFKTSHDETIALLRTEENKMLESNYNNLRAKIASKYLYETSDVIFRLPNNINEFSEEGNALNICVFRMGYHKKMVENKCTIVFARKKSNPDKSWVCIEISPEGRVVQTRGFGNSTPTDDFFKAFKEYKKHILQTA